MAFDYHTISTGMLVIFAAIVWTLWQLASVFITANQSSLRAIPGSIWARYTVLYRLNLVRSGLAHQTYNQMHKKYGPIVRSAPKVVDVSDPKLIPVIYGINSKFVKSDFYKTLAVHYEYVPMDSLFTMRDPEKHRALKRPVAQKFAMSSIKSLEPLVDPCSQIFVDSMTELAGKRVDLGAWLQWYAFDVIGAITFSKRFGFMESRRDVNNVIKGIEFALTYAGVVGQVPWLHPFLLGNMALMKLRSIVLPDAHDPIRTTTNMVNESIEEYDGKVEGDLSFPQDFLSYLRQQEKSTGNSMSHKDMMNHLTNNLLAGSDTTAISLRALFYYVLRNQRVYTKLQKEIDEADRAGKLSRYVTYAESLELEYLQLCIKEAMRMHPGVGFPLERVVPAPGVELGGYSLPPGTIVGMNAAVIHRNKEVFGADADTYRPERWTESGASGDLKEMDRTLLTFGAGSRTCIGKNISIMEMGKFVPQILRSFDLVWDSDKPEWNITTYWFSRQTGLNVKFLPRQRDGAIV